MQQISNNLQILAPAGSCDQLVAAVNNGCDAVYLGLDSFNARMKAPNFTLANLSEWVDYCHLFGVKVYVAINTSIKNDEFKQAVGLLKNVYLKNADGVIVTDLALMRIAGALPKPFEVVASTQLNVHDKYGAEFVKKCGATTVVCARECSLEQIREIAATGIKVECFLHGAMCVCQSGQCLFSSMVGGNSGNRGLCAQPCRKYYSVAENANRGGYLLSARDMCSLDTAIELAKAGATTFKVEGRNRRPEYAGLTSRIYRELFDCSFVQGDNDYDLLAEMFNRGMSYNRYLKGLNNDIVYPAAQNHTGVEIGVVKDGGVIASRKLRKGDGLKVFDGDNEICGGIILGDSSNSGGIVRAQFSGKVSNDMRVHRTTSVTLCNEVMSAKKKLNVNIEFVAKAGCNPRIVARCNDVAVSVEGDFVVEQALSKPTLHDDIAAQLQKSGETCYTICDIAIKIDDIFIAKSQINALRRAVLDKLSKELVLRYNNQFANRISIDLSADSVATSRSANTTRATVDSDKPICSVVCYDEDQLVAAKDICEQLIFKPNVLDKKAIDVARRCGAYIDLPSFADLKYIAGLFSNSKVGVVCNNVGQVEFARQHNLSYVAGGGLNLFNDNIVNLFDDAVTFVYSRELTLKEISAFANKRGLTFVDGKIPLMQLCHCPYKVAYSCDCANCQAGKFLTYKDEFGNLFEINRRKIGSQCLFELINGSKLSVVSKLKLGGRYLIDYDKSVLKHYLNVNSGINDGYAELRPYTKGRLYDKIN